MWSEGSVKVDGECVESGDCGESGECGECRKCVPPKPLPRTPIHHHGLMDVSGKTIAARVSV